MRKLLSNPKRTSLLLGIFFAIIFVQSIFIVKLFSDKMTKNHEVNLVKINTEKDSIDYKKMKNDIMIMDQSIREISHFLTTKNITNEKIMALDKDSLSHVVYLAKVSNRYSQYLVDLQKKLQEVPLGMPTNGYISSNFGTRKNPIPPKVILASLAKTKPEPKINEEKDSLGNITDKTVANSQTVKNKEKNNPPAESDQLQFHKGLDIAVAYGSEVHCAARGTVIFAGQKGGYGNCVIISHGNGLATLYGHLSEILVKTNDQVQVNDVIAKSGNSGRSTGPHLHYEVHKNGSPVNPKLFLNF